MPVNSSELATPAPSPASECVPPPPLEPKGGQHSPAGEGARGEPIRTTREKAWHSVYSVVETVKLRQMGSFLGWCSLVSGASIGDFLSCLGCSCQPSTKYFFPHRTMFQIMCPHSSATWAGSRAGPPVSACVSVDTFTSRILFKEKQKDPCTLHLTVPGTMSLQCTLELRDYLITISNTRQYLQQQISVEISCALDLTAWIVNSAILPSLCS